jgi:hypothetical protein
MGSLEKMLELLMTASRDPLSRKDIVREFQSCFSNSQKGLKDSIGDDVYDVLADLNYDLHFFQADPSVRAGDSSLYGDTRLEKEIETALRRLSQLGFSFPGGVRRLK